VTEYLVLSLNRAVPLVWEYNREITFDVTFSRSYSNLPKSNLRRASAASIDSSYYLDSTSKRVARIFGTPPQPTISGATASRPYLYKSIFYLSYRTGNPQFRIDLYYVDPTSYIPTTYITSFTPSIASDRVYIDFGDPPNAFTNGYQLEWNKLYALVLVPTFADSSNYAGFATCSWGSGSDFLVVCKRGYYNGTNWTIQDGEFWTSYGYNYLTIAYAWYYTPPDVTVPVAKSSEAFRSYFNGWTSRNLPSGFTIWRESINNVTNLTAGTEVKFDDAYTHSMTFYTTADVSAFTQTDVANIKWKYDINPITIDKFYASEAYLQKIEFLDTTVTNRVRLNDSYEQEFSGSGGTSLAFDPPVLWWKAEVLSGRVRMTALVFE